MNKRTWNQLSALAESLFRQSEEMPAGWDRMGKAAKAAVNRKAWQMDAASRRLIEVIGQRPSR